MENETMNPTEELSSLNQNHIKISEQAQNYLLTTSNWTKFFAIINFIGIALMILVGAMLLVMSKFIDQFQAPSSYNLPTTQGNIFFIIGILYILIGAILIVPFAYLNRFSNSCRRAIMLENEAEMEDSFYFMKVFWKFIGIFIIVYISLILLVLPLLMLFSI
ncbi:MAG TPA: hypothetical protein PLB66_06805 [Bacteroidales bacterium]|nr:hypothetical protein [Bacteroidales bacterium]HOS58319.1 hypothetical protein [Bacteroidales bacterium]HQA87424.1 hypothetical protein [Bacteroidales bacterium]